MVQTDEKKHLTNKQATEHLKSGKKATDQKVQHTGVQIGLTPDSKDNTNSVDGQGLYKENENKKQHRPEGVLHIEVLYPGGNQTIGLRTVLIHARKKEPVIENQCVWEEE